MAFSEFENGTSTVASEMSFLKRDPLWAHEKPYRMRYQPTEEIPRTNFILEILPVSVRDMRGMLPKLSLDTNGFEVHELNTKLGYTEFFDYERVTSVYVKEVQQLVKQVCQAKHAHPLDYEVRTMTINYKLAGLLLGTTKTTQIRVRHDSFPVSTGQNYNFGQPSLISHIGTLIIEGSRVERALFCEGVLVKSSPRDFGRNLSVLTDEIDVTLDAVREIIRAVYGAKADEILKGRVQCVT